MKIKTEPNGSSGENSKPCSSDPFQNASLGRRLSGDNIPGTGVDRDYCNELFGLQLLATAMEDEATFSEHLRHLVAERGGRLLHSYSEYFGGESEDALLARVDRGRIDAIEGIVAKGNSLYDEGKLSPAAAIQLTEEWKKILFEP